MTLETAPKHLNLMIDFVVVKVPSMYNIILGQIAKVVLSTDHFIIKSLTEASVRKVWWNQSMAKKCYFTTIKWK